MVECPHCHKKTISGFKIYFSDPGKELVCSECQKTSTVPSGPKVIGLLLIVMYFFSKPFMEDETAIVALITMLVLFTPYAYLASRKIVPKEVKKQDV